LEVLHDIGLKVGRKQSLCLIGPNGAGKSTVLHAIFGFNTIFSGSIVVGEGPNKMDVTKLSPSDKLKKAGIAYILQDKSVFPGMTVEENLWMGGFLKDQPAQAKRSAEAVFDKYPRLAARRKHQAKVLSGGERRLLEISRALVMEPEVLLVDEPSIGLEPRFIDMVFEILHDLQHGDGKTIIMVEQNAKKGLEFADIGYVLVSGEIAIAGTGDELLANPKVGQLFLGG
jgi:branched-chain amino acid transport system ATP-binding protein